ncbi:molybdopterin-dependent oxidoreductase [Saccharopolyspora phatthalungensis]|uniref:DMSO/TMAO reductase YedYZ molybdopterin-dependent catalytic subunit n=1 Tax=Saccharopolyspora phatthalungensis TaxID=664693 RepID=A0A840QG86_9PSEU|nr:molybdopterin-dependent oxidoreductase [Saccharopolyspora phatthalungensis]MBB5157619.1 DMSO/TMAO reductase YedYZ molybdopterin-dependent catalytic subunit [Saccharopolyspora phatthalungensis]
MTSLPIPRLRAAVVGVLAAAAALGAGHLVAGLTSPRTSPFAVVGNTLIDLTPEPVKEFAIALFGTADKLALLTGMTIVIALLAAVAGLLSRRHWWPGVLVIGVFGLVGVGAALARPTGGLAAPLTSLVVGVVVFWWLHHVAAVAPEAPVEVDADRRRFLVASTLVVLGAGAAGIAGGFLQRGAGVTSSQLAAAARIPKVTAPPIPPDADFVASGTPTFLTPNRDFYRIDTALVVPQVRAEDWRLRLHGMVQRELVLSFDDLLQRRLEARPITLTCVSNEVGGPLISTATFVGVPVRDLLLEAGVRPGAQQLFTTSVDGYTAGTPLDVLLEPDRGALLAVGMNGEPLPLEHGFPVRMVVPGLYGYVSATKWLVDAEVTTFGRAHYWERRGWARQAPIKTESRIDRPRAGASVPAGAFTVAGIAWAQHTGIDRVEVRADGGAWQPAELATDVSRDTWRMWRTTLHLPPGDHVVECRATDRSGQPQTPERHAVIPNGATGWHSVRFTCAA